VIGTTQQLEAAVVVEPARDRPSGTQPTSPENSERTSSRSSAVIRGLDNRAHPESGACDRQPTPLVSVLPKICVGHTAEHSGRVGDRRARHTPRGEYRCATGRTRAAMSTRFKQRRLDTSALPAPVGAEQRFRYSRSNVAERPPFEQAAKQP